MAVQSVKANLYSLRSYYLLCALFSVSLSVLLECMELLCLTIISSVVIVLDTDVAIEWSAIRIFSTVPVYLPVY